MQRCLPHLPIINDGSTECCRNTHSLKMSHSKFHVPSWKDIHPRLAGECVVMIKTLSARVAGISLAFKYGCVLDCIHTETVHRLVLKCPSPDAFYCAFNNYPCVRHYIHTVTVHRVNITTINVPSTDVAHCGTSLFA